jgi:Sugar (and other) transporter.
VGILLSVFQQFVGINVIFYYSSTLWHSVGFSESDATLTSVLTSVVNIAANLYVVAFGCSWGPVVWVMLGEMFNNWIRASALAVAAAAQWLANWLITTTFPPLSKVGLGLAYGVYTTFALLALVFVLKAVQETKGKELEEMA